VHKNSVQNSALIRALLRRVSIIPDSAIFSPKQPYADFAGAASARAAGKTWQREVLP
jgi:hypothetical protein